MRIPVRSESDAFRVACGVAAVGAIALLVGAYIDAVAGIVLFAGVLLGWLLRQWPADPPARLREAAVAGQRAGAPHRVLIVANEVPRGKTLMARLARAPGPEPLVEVLEPVLQSRTHFVTTDIDHETEDARRRLRESLRWLRTHGFKATGEVGDPINPLAGVEDELRRYDVDEVIVAGHRPGDLNWIEQGMLERLRAELEVPVAMIDAEADQPLGVAAGLQ